MTMNDAAIAAAVGAERLRLADLAEELDPHEWDVPSLCAAWTVRGVIAHLTVTTRAGVALVLLAAARARGNFDRMEVNLAADRAARFTDAELIAQLRESATSSRRTPASRPMDPLMDLVIHGQDVARPLGREYTSPPNVVAASLGYVAANSFMGGPKRFAGLHVTATDAAWALGNGPEIRGPAEDLLLIASGRPAGLAALAGPGVETLRRRLT